MTEKRFKSRCYEKQKNVVIYDKGDKLFDVSYRDFEDAYYLKMKLSPVIDKLNELSEENSKLHTQNDFLKDENQHMRDLVNENRQLKSTIKEVIELLSEEVDLFTDKATEHDINAYIELKELDNKDAFYMAIATKKAIKMLKELSE